MYNLSTGGFRPATFTAIVDGIVESIRHAHEDLAPAEVLLSHGELHDASINRSPSSFDRNPASDRDFFPGRIDPLTTLIQIDRGQDTVGAIHFFATHGTSMTNRNLLITGDNKGFAAHHWERTVRGADYLAGQPEFVGAFAQTNAGDMSPHVDGPVDYGPRRSEDERANTRRIGLAQFEDASAQLGSGTPIGTDVDARFTYVDLTDVLVGGQYTPDGREHRTGRPMIAAAMFAGTDEGEGFPGFRQGRNFLWDNISRLVYRLGARTRAAQEPKGMVIPAHLLNRLQPFIQETVPVQLIRIGRLYLIGIPGEPTITSGLRLRRTVASILGADLNDVLCVGYSNAYIHYVTTPEEYLEQRYEGGSTLFGRWELPALMQTVAALAEAMRDGRPVSPGGGPRRRKPRRLAAGTARRQRLLRRDPGTAGRDVPARRHGGSRVRQRLSEQRLAPQQHLSGSAAPRARPVDAGRRRRRLVDHIRVGARGASRVARPDPVGDPRRRRGRAVPHRPPRRDPGPARPHRAVPVDDARVHRALEGAHHHPCPPNITPAQPSTPSVTLA